MSCKFVEHDRQGYTVRPEVMERVLDRLAVRNLVSAGGVPIEVLKGTGGELAEDAGVMRNSANPIADALWEGAWDRMKGLWRGLPWGVRLGIATGGLGVAAACAEAVGRSAVETPTATRVEIANSDEQKIIEALEFGGQPMTVPIDGVNRPLVGISYVWDVRFNKGRYPRVVVTNFCVDKKGEVCPVEEWQFVPSGVFDPKTVKSRLVYWTPAREVTGGWEVDAMEFQIGPDNVLRPTKKVVGQGIFPTDGGTPVKIVKTPEEESLQFRVANWIVVHSADPALAGGLLTPTETQAFLSQITATPRPPEATATLRPTETSTPTPTSTPDRFIKGMREQMGEWGDYYQCDSNRCIFKYVYSGELKQDVPIVLPDGTVVGAAKIALVGMYLDASGQKREVLAVDPGYVILLDGKNMFGQLVAEDALKADAEKMAALFDPGRVFPLYWYSDYDKDLERRLKQNPNAKPYPQRARGFLDKYYAAWANEWKAFKISGDPSIKLLVGAATGGTGEAIEPSP